MKDRIIYGHEMDPKEEVMEIAILDWYSPDDFKMLGSNTWQVIFKGKKRPSFYLLLNSVFEDDIDSGYQFTIKCEEGTFYIYRK